MSVYFARAEGTDLVKIGFATNVQRRLKWLQSGCPYRLMLVRETPGDRSREAAFHTYFAEHHVDRDWFRWSPAMETATVAATRVPDAEVGGFSALIRELGGPAEVSRRTGINPDAVKKMSARNRIPGWHWPAFIHIGVTTDRLMSCQVGSSRRKAA